MVYFVEKYPADATMNFETLQTRLLAVLRTRLRNGELTERRLARLTGFSQPHIHNVLNGARVLSPELADEILRRLQISLTDLLAPGEAGAGESFGGTAPVLEGWLGPGLPLPRQPSPVERYPFPAALLAAVEEPVVVRLSEDPRMERSIRKNDLALLDHARRRRMYPDPSSLYVINRQGEGLIRRVRREGQWLRLVTDDGGEGERISLAHGHLLDIVRARVSWLGRTFDLP
ncbi:MAG: hypothetical protein RMK57_07530 [Bryobacterales bacterium]|nr:S24 family peptidase [Bryobacteraceae bacterium]MDW8354366.1 hypothetical protein [Bryobacterales bacterium]